MEITIEVSDTVGQQLLPFQHRLPEVLERGLRVLQMEAGDSFQDEDTIKPSPALQERVSELLATSKEGQLSHQEERELDRYMVLEHLVRLAKIHAYRHLAKQP